MAAPSAEAERPVPEGERAGARALRDMQRDITRFLRFRERTRWELVRYLERRGYDAAVIQPAVERLVAERLIDDRRFAELFIRDRRRLRPMSRAAVLRDLRAKGISAELAEEALDASDPPWEDEALAVELLHNRWLRWAEGDRRARAMHLLARRGFSRGVINAAIAHMIRESGGR